MNHLFNNINSTKVGLMKHEIRKMILAEAERAFVFGNLQSEEDNLVDRLGSPSFIKSWSIYKDTILERKLSDWGFGQEFELKVAEYHEKNI